MMLAVAPSPEAAAERAAAIAVDRVSKVYGQGGEAVFALEDVSFNVQPGELVCLVGASGCGKSTLLNLMAGLDRPSSGSIAMPAGNVALMFQDPALFPWLTVEQNIEFPLEARGVDRSERRRRVPGLLSLVNLDGFGRKRPHELSGGMRQRVALARSLAQDSSVLLMDEPFGALDAITRDLLHHELEQLWRRSGLTIVFVTHNVREAVRLGDRVIVLSSRPGRVAAEFQVDLPRPRHIDSAANAELAATITEHLHRTMTPVAGE
jgi:NitT/TauT family transport system ATP-binding protein